MAITEGLVLNSLDLQAGAFAVEALDLTPPPKKPEWAQAADSDGADLVRTPLFDNRTITASVRIQPQASMNLALEKLGELVDMLQEAEKNPGGIPLVWTPATSTKTITFYVLTGSVTGIPISVEKEPGWFVASPLVMISMTCKPFGYGAEVEAAAAKANETGLSIVILTVPAVSGDVPAEGRLVITDTAAVGRRYVEWGLENRYYDPATELVLDSDDMIPVAGVQSAAPSTAYTEPGGAHAQIVTTLLSQPTICANTGNLGHVGTFRVKARVETLREAALIGGEALNVHVRLAWQDGEGPLRANTWQTFSNGDVFVEMDLGIVSITPAAAGTQKWLGQIEAYSGNVPGKDLLFIDYLTLIPVSEGYGKARGVSSSASGKIVAFDDFTSGTLSGSLNTRTAALGGGWATSGATTDFTVAPGQSSRKTVSDAGPRFAILGTAQTNMRVAVTANGVSGPGEAAYSRAAIARWTDSSNYLAAILKITVIVGGGIVGVVTVIFQLVKVVAGVTTVLAEAPCPSVTKFPVMTTLFVTVDGGIVARAWAGDSSVLVSLIASDADVATGGILASGQGGHYDYCHSGESLTRVFNRFETLVVKNPPYCIQPSQSMQVRFDSAITTDSTGVYYGPVPEYRGSRFFVPQAGEAHRTSRILVKADRNDLEESDQKIIGDNFTAQAYVTPRFHVIPR